MVAHSNGVPQAAHLAAPGEAAAVELGTTEAEPDGALD